MLLSLLPCIVSVPVHVPVICMEKDLYPLTSVADAKSAFNAPALRPVTSRNAPAIKSAISPAAEPSDFYTLMVLVPSVSLVC